MGQSEGERLFKMLVDYAREMNEARCYDVSLILEGFDKTVLSKYIMVSPLATKWSAVIREYGQLDPREQSKLIGFYEE
ncbi:MAG: hypothetical protein ACREBU_13425 [Nitrososphaera sp.]